MLKVLCDECGCDLSESHGMRLYRINVFCDSAPDYGGVSLDVLVEPPFENQMCFCGIVCLKEWFDNI